jgi:anti-anti-sigma factor
MQTGSYLYAWLNNIYIIKLVGSLTYSTSSDLDGFIKRIFAEGGFSNILIDLSETDSLDSTNLGLLAKIGRYTLDNFQRKTSMISPREEINRVLKSMGFDSVFTIITEPEHFSAELAAIPHTPQNEHETARTILDAHRTLMELNEANRSVFKNVVRFLEKEIESREPPV